MSNDTQATEHHVQVSGVWCNDSTADLVVECSPCPTGHYDDWMKCRITVLHDGASLDFDALRLMVDQHRSAGAAA